MSACEATGEAFGAAYQIISALAGEAGRFDDPAVQGALDYFQRASEGHIQDVAEILPFHLGNGSE